MWMNPTTYFEFISEWLEKNEKQRNYRLGHYFCMYFNVGDDQELWDEPNDHHADFYISIKYLNKELN